MQCKKSQQKISEYLDDELPEEERRQLEEHIEQCDRCRRELDSLRRTVSMLHELPEMRAPEGLSQRVTQQLHIETERPRIVSVWRRGLAVAAGVVAVITAVFLVTDGLRRGAGPAPQAAKTEGGDEVMEMAKKPDAVKIQTKSAKEKRRAVGRASGEVAGRPSSDAGKSSSESVPHQMMTVPSKEKNGQTEQMLALAENVGLNEAKIDVKEDGTKVITLRMNRNSYEKFLQKLARVQQNGGELKNTAVARNNIYFQRLARGYNQPLQVRNMSEMNMGGVESKKEQSPKLKTSEDKESVATREKVARKKKKAKEELDAAFAPAGTAAKSLSDESRSEEKKEVKLEEATKREEKLNRAGNKDRMRVPEEVVLQIEIVPSARPEASSEQTPAADKAPATSN